MAAEREAQKLWDGCVAELRKSVPPRIYKLWFDSIRPIRLESDVLTVEVRDVFSETWIHDNYGRSLRETLSRCAGRPIGYRTVSRPESAAAAPRTAPAAERRRARRDNGINPELNFKSFVVSKNSELAHSAASAVAKVRGSAHNPLFIYGNVGLGKTHLLHAIGNHVDERREGDVVRYLSCEKFTNEFINGIKSRQMTRFRNRYRKADYLLIDDIQFLSGKSETQQEFFHTFNELFMAGKQIVLTSDCPPQVIRNLEDRLLSRFECGLVTDLQAPNFETRLAILRHKVKGRKSGVSEEILAMIAERVRSNVRRLEGALYRVLAYLGLDPTQGLSVKGAEDLLKEVFKEEEDRTLGINEIQKEVAGQFEIPVSDMFNRKRTQNIALARQVAMYLCRRFTDKSLKDVGEAFNRGHGTVLHACNAIKDRVEVGDLQLRNRIERIERQLKFSRPR